MPSRKQVVDDLIAIYGQACFYCKRDLAVDEITLDHYIPRAAGGLDSFENLRPACFPCNNWKADRVPLPDGSLPPKVSKTPRLIKSARPKICFVCESGRRLGAGSTCRICGSAPMPAVRPRYLKANPRECDHTESWCRACCLWSPGEMIPA